MVVISAVRETEAWSGASIVLGIVLLVVAIGVLIWQVRRFLQGP